MSVIMRGVPEVRGRCIAPAVCGRLGHQVFVVE
jgi:hypothetical protein